MGVIAEISMSAKLLKRRLRKDPDSVERVLGEIERLEDELMDAYDQYERESKCQRD